MSIKGKSLVSLDQWSLADIDRLLSVAAEIKQRPEAYRQIGQGQILATLFYEPSTRTKLSFESAMLRLGGSTLGFSDASSSSAAKGEDIADTLRVISGYADLAVMRHPQEGAAKLAAAYATIPLVNAGDGGHQHPTQTLTDLLTIKEAKGSLSGHRVAFCGDLKYGRTVHSLIWALARYQVREFVLISPPELRLPDALVEQLTRQQVTLQVCRHLEEAIAEIDLLYMTRVQRERFPQEADYLRLQHSYQLDLEQLQLARPDLAVLHPLPRLQEISRQVDADPRALYFRQAANGVFARMALIALQLGLVENVPDSGETVACPPAKLPPGLECHNPRCITNWDRAALPGFHLVAGAEQRYACDYCDEVVTPQA